MRLAAVALAVGLFFDRGHSVMRVTGNGVQRVTPGGLAACGAGGLAVVRRRGDGTQGDDLFVVRHGHTTRVTNSPGSAERDPTWIGNRLVYGSGALIGSYDLWRFDGHRSRRLTHLKGDEQSPSSSPDGRRLVFSNDGVYVMALGGKPRRIARGDEATWSANGVIAFRDQEGIYAISPDGSGRVRLRAPSGDVGGLTWSPDGSQLAFNVSRTDGQEPLTGVWVINADGTNAHAVSDPRLDAFGPVWSPDGTQLAYTGNRAVWIAGRRIGPGFARSWCR